MALYIWSVIKERDHQTTCFSCLWSLCSRLPLILVAHAVREYSLAYSPQTTRSVSSRPFHFVVEISAPLLKAFDRVHFVDADSHCGWFRSTCFLCPSHMRHLPGASLVHSRHSVTQRLQPPDVLHVSCMQQYIYIYYIASCSLATDLTYLAYANRSTYESVLWPFVRQDNRVM
jgi:hypothetical protein